MQETPKRPVLEITFPCATLKRNITTHVLIPDGTLPMDLYNGLLRLQGLEVDIEEKWLTNKPRIVSQEEAAVLALEADLLSVKVDKLTSSNFSGNWRWR